jgi:glycosyltransferase involved in cell wall biosynthesis
MIKTELISVVIPTFNEEENIKELIQKISYLLESNNINYEQIIIDNSSTDGTIEILKEIAKNNKKIKVIINTKNFGPLRSPIYGILQSDGDACILMNADFQDPPELIIEYIKLWKEGNKIILAEKIDSDENIFLKKIRIYFYKFLNKISETNLTINTTGSGIFDKSIISILKKINDPYPYFRGLLSELGFEIKTIKFKQPKRKYGISKNSFFSLYDFAILGIIKHSKLPIRIMVIFGFIFSFISALVAIFFLFYKIMFWNSFALGIAPIIIGIFLASSIQIFLLGLIGEYVSIILTHNRKMPLVFEKERINF